MQLTKHLSTLLYRYDCVTIPGFGAFLGTPSPAEFDSLSATIYPPTKTISFNAQLQSNDGLLAHAIAVAQQTTYEQAVRLVHKEVVRWKSMLHDGQTIELDRIGKLHLNTEQNVVFVPAKDHNHLADSFGLDPVKVEKIDRTKILKGTPKVIDFNDQNNPTSSDTQGTNSNPLRHVAAAAAAAVMGYFGFTTYEEYQLDQRMAQEMEVRAEAIEEVQQAVFDLGELPKLSIHTVPEETYHIIGGAFAVESNADRFLAKLHKKGFDAAQKLAPNSYGLHLVAFDQRTDRKAAIELLRQVQRTEISDAWMLKR